MKPDRTLVTTTRPTAVVTTALVAAFLAASCASGGGKTAATPTRTTASTASASASNGSTKPSSGACDIVSDGVVTAVLGVAIVRREGKKTPDGTVTCLKGLARTNDPKGFTFVNVAVFAGGAAGVDTTASQPGVKKVPGLGDRALYLPSAGAIYIARGADLVQVQLVKGGVPGSQADCVTVAKDVLSRRG